MSTNTVRLVLEVCPDGRIALEFDTTPGADDALASPRGLELPAVAVAEHIGVLVSGPWQDELKAVAAEAAATVRHLRVV